MNMFNIIMPLSPLSDQSQLHTRTTQPGLLCMKHSILEDRTDFSQGASLVWRLNLLILIIIEDFKMYLFHFIHRNATTQSHFQILYKPNIKTLLKQLNDKYSYQLHILLLLDILNR